MAEGLEEIVGSPTKEYDPRLAGRFRSYCVSVSAGWLYYTPVFAALIDPVALGYDGERILKNRLMGALVSTIIMEPYKMMRHTLAKKFNVTRESPRWKRVLFEIASSAPIQIPVYSALLYKSGADLSDPTTLLTVGLGFGFVSGSSPIMGKWMDTWRDANGIEPVVYKSPEEPHDEGRFARWAHDVKDRYARISAIEVNPFRIYAQKTSRPATESSC
jgi:hypothetical protein